MDIHGVCIEFHGEPLREKLDLWDFRCAFWVMSSRRFEHVADIVGMPQKLLKSQGEVTAMRDQQQQQQEQAQMQQAQQVAQMAGAAAPMAKALPEEARAIVNAEE